MPSRRWRTSAAEAEGSSAANSSPPEAGVVKGKGKAPCNVDFEFTGVGGVRNTSISDDRAAMPPRRWRAGMSAAHGSAALAHVVAEAGPHGTSSELRNSSTLESGFVGNLARSKGKAGGKGVTANFSAGMSSDKSNGKGKRENTKFRAPWAAGIVALSGQGPCQCVCLVAKTNGRLGFPKGGAEEYEKTPLATALREWQEETNLPVEPLTGLNEQSGVCVDKWNCHYFMASWNPSRCTTADGTTSTAEQAIAGQSWSVADDATDPDPVVRAMWMPISEALTHPMLSAPRKDLLRKAIRWCSSA